MIMNCQTCLNDRQLNMQINTIDNPQGQAKDNLMKIYEIAEVKEEDYELEEGGEKNCMNCRNISDSNKNAPLAYQIITVEANSKDRILEEYLNQ